MNLPRNRLETFMWVIMNYHGTWYTWSGDSPLGFDCSGLIVEGLKSADMIPRKSDYTADGLWRKFRHPSKRLDIPKPGSLCFWFDRHGIAVHVAVCINEDSYIGAEGGGRNVKTLEDAVKYNAFIKIRPLSSRPGARFLNIWT